MDYIAMSEAVHIGLFWSLVVITIIMTVPIISWSRCSDPDHPVIRPILGIIGFAALVYCMNYLYTFEDELLDLYYVFNNHLSVYK